MCLSPAAPSAAALSSPDTKSSSSLLKKFHQVFSVLPVETYSRKVFIGGLPPDIDQGEIMRNIAQNFDSD